MDPLNARPMAIGVLECLGVLSLASGKEGLHLLAWPQGQGAPWSACTGDLTRAGFAISLGKLDRDFGVAIAVLSWRPAIARLSLGTRDRLGFPINGKMGEIIAGLRLIPVILESRTNQIYFIIRPALDKLGGIDIARIHQMLIRQQLLFGQTAMNHGERALIWERRRRGLHMGNQLRGLLITGLGEMHLVARPEDRSFLGRACVEVIG